MDTTQQIKIILSETLNLGKRMDSVSMDTPLLGNIPELDSSAVIAVIVALEQKFSISIHDDEISAKTFKTIGTLKNFIEQKISEKQVHFPWNIGMNYFSGFPAGSELKFLEGN